MDFSGNVFFTKKPFLYKDRQRSNVALEREIAAGGGIILLKLRENPVEEEVTQIEMVKNRILREIKNFFF